MDKVEADLEDEIELMRVALQSSILNTANQVHILNDDISILSDFEGDDISVATTNTTISKDCYACMSSSVELEPFNYKLEADCPCKATGCVKCWQDYYTSKKQDAIIKCPICRQDIRGFLLAEGL
jgi:hypothetical protein